MNAVRRSMLGVALGALCPAPAMSVTQRTPKEVVVCLMPSNAPGADDAASASFSELLSAHGLVAGRDVRVSVVRGPDRDFATSSPKWRAQARRVVDRRPDVIVVHMVWLDYFRAATKDIPVVFNGAIELGEHAGLTSQRRPGGNVTGLALPFFELQRKRVEMLMQLRPSARRVAVVHADAGGVHNERFRSRLHDAAAALGLESRQLIVPSGADLDLAHALAAERVELADFLFGPSAQTLARCTAAGVATSFAVGANAVRAGGLLSYAPANTDRILAALVARILAGEHPSSIPAEQPTHYHLAINLRTARALGLEVPVSIRVRADEVIG